MSQPHSPNHLPIPSHHVSSDTKPPPTQCNTITDSTTLCTICRETSPDPTLSAMVPTCSHTFCLSCLLSWSAVRELCPNCKSPFTNLLVHRDLLGSLVQGPCTKDGTLPWLREHVALLHRVPWVNATPVLPPLVPELDDAIVFASGGPNPSNGTAIVHRSPAPSYVHEDFEDELESRFWEEEEKQFDRLMRSSRVMSNRRFGANGYISSGRLRATRVAPAPGAGKASKKGNSASSSGSVANGGHPASERRDQRTGRSGNGSGGRKKKLKKNSREGIAAAARKKAEGEANAAAAAAATAAAAGQPGAGPSTSGTSSSCVDC